MTFTANTDITIKVYFTKNAFDSNKPDDTISLTANQEKTTTYDRKSIYKFTFNYLYFITSAKIDGVVLNCIELFKNCSGLTSLYVSHLDTSNVTDMMNIFYNCSKLTTLDISHFDTSKVTNMGLMFYNCLKLTTIGPVDKASGWQHTSTNYIDMFTNCPAKPLPTWYK